VTSSIIQYLSHPTVGLLPPLIVDGDSPYTGNVTISTWHGLDSAPHDVVNSFGLYYSWAFHSPGLLPTDGTFGRSLGWRDDDTDQDETRFVDRVLQIVVQHRTELGLGVWVSDQVVDVHQATGYVVWGEALPGRIGLYTFPGTWWNLSWFLIPGS
jgi:hypothetical protein